MMAEYDIIITSQFMGIWHLVTKKVWDETSNLYERYQSSITCVLTESLGSQIA